MKAYLLTRSGKPKVLKLHELNEPAPAPGEVKVRLQYIGLNYSEILSEYHKPLLWSLLKKF